MGDEGDGGVWGDEEAVLPESFLFSSHSPCPPTPLITVSNL
jgi:hypothetical protein